MARPKYSRFYLSDLHVHTAADADHRYGADAGPRGPNPEFATRLVGAFADAGVTVIAVTDHNRVDWWPVMKAAGDERGVAVFPGVEINVNRCHLLGIWDATEEGYRLAERFTESRHKPKSSPYLNGAPRPVDKGNVAENATDILEHGGSSPRTRRARTSASLHLASARMPMSSRAVSSSAPSMCSATKVPRF